jgi:hypothetical protein
MKCNLDLPALQQRSTLGITESLEEKVIPPFSKRTPSAGTSELAFNYKIQTFTFQSCTFSWRKLLNPNIILGKHLQQQYPSTEWTEADHPVKLKTSLLFPKHGSVLEQD